MFRTTCQPQTLVCNSRFRTWRFQLSLIWKIQSNTPAGARPGSGKKRPERQKSTPIYDVTQKNRKSKPHQFLKYNVQSYTIFWGFYLLSSTIAQRVMLENVHRYLTLNFWPHETYKNSIASVSAVIPVSDSMQCGFVNIGAFAHAFLWLKKDNCQMKTQRWRKLHVDEIKISSSQGFFKLERTTYLRKNVWRIDSVSSI